MLPSLQEITPLPLSRVYSPLIAPPLSLTVYSGSQLGRGRARICSSPAPPSRVFYPPLCPIIAERLQRYASSALANFHGPYLPQIFRTKTKSFQSPWIRPNSSYPALTGVLERGRIRFFTDFVEKKQGSTLRGYPVSVSPFNPTGKLSTDLGGWQA